MQTENQKKHWENIYETKDEQDFSWFQEYPKTSIEFLLLFNLSKKSNIIDIGGGDSHFVDALIELEFKNIYVLDISENSLERAKQRLGRDADKINWIVSEITEFKTDVKFDFWHDRAAFHFLTTDDKIEKYVHIAEQSINPDGYLILGTFAENGPEKCSGLEIKQYSEVSMSGRFEKRFKKIRCIEETHTTPFNTQQNFLFCSFQKKQTDP
jgi:2-polyprenyl-3-methyl-5-hydroxy-6-metoxy-1,4-benzoquinol methylase